MAERDEGVMGYSHDTRQGQYRSAERGGEQERRLTTITAEGGGGAESRYRRPLFSKRQRDRLR